MKKKVLLICMVTLVSISHWGVSRLNDDHVGSSLLLASVEALSSEEKDETENGGPRREFECINGGHKLGCLAENRVSCTDSECF